MPILVIHANISSLFVYRSRTGNADRPKLPVICSGGKTLHIASIGYFQRDSLKKAKKEEGKGRRKKREGNGKKEFLDSLSLAWLILRFSFTEQRRRDYKMKFLFRCTALIKVSYWNFASQRTFIYPFARSTRIMDYIPAPIHWEFRSIVSLSLKFSSQSFPTNSSLSWREWRNELLLRMRCNFVTFSNYYQCENDLPTFMNFFHVLHFSDEHHQKETRTRLQVSSSALEFRSLA